MKTIIFSAAGGNPTAINFDGNLKRKDYSRINNEIQTNYPEVEQVAFYEEENGLPKLQMAGGEFCGNATRSFACLLSKFDQQSNFKFYVSGYPGLVEADVKSLGSGKYFCKAFFDSMTAKIDKKKHKGKDVEVVDMGGIAHIIVKEEDFPFDEADFTVEMKQIKDELGVDKEAVGVLWTSEKKGKIIMKPVVWVRAIDTCFYETSCGSGSLAIAFAQGEDIEVTQPSGKNIAIEFLENGGMVMSSEMEEISGK